VVALTGDAVTTGDNPNAKGVFEINSIGLLKIIGSLRAGHDSTGIPLRGGADFLPGVVVNPNVKNPAAELRRLTKKREAGARYALSQPVFDREVAVSFLKEAQAVGIPIFLGLLPLKTIGAAKHVSDIPGIKMADSVLSQLSGENDRDVSEFFLELCVGLAKSTAPLVAGFHVIGGATPRLGLQLARELVRVFK
jgi:5,10-methylenetetrahydrofolate reductase